MKSSMSASRANLQKRSNTCSCALSPIVSSIARRDCAHPGRRSGQRPRCTIRDLTGRVTAWIEVGMPDPGRLNRGFKLAGRAAVHTHRDVQKVLAQLSAARIERLSAVPVYEFDRSFVDEIAGLVERRSTLSISVTERELYLEIRGRTFNATIVEHRAE